MADRCLTFQRRIIGRATKSGPELATGQGPGIWRQPESKPAIEQVLEGVVTAEQPSCGWHRVSKHEILQIEPKQATAVLVTAVTALARGR